MENHVRFKGYILGYHTIHIFSQMDWKDKFPDTETVLRLNGYEIYGEWEKFKNKYGDPYEHLEFDKNFVIIQKPVMAFQTNRLSEIE